jgi:hypothetical protein
MNARQGKLMEDFVEKRLVSTLFIPNLSFLYSNIISPLYPCFEERGTRDFCTGRVGTICNRKLI